MGTSRTRDVVPLGMLSPVAPNPWIVSPESMAKEVEPAARDKPETKLLLGFAPVREILKAAVPFWVPVTANV